MSRGAFNAGDAGKRARTLAVAVLVTLLAVSRAAGAQSVDPELNARKHFAAGEYKEALEIYVGLYAQTMHPTYLRNIGRCYQDMGDPDKALSAFHEYLRKAPNLEPGQRAEVERFIREMEDLKRQRAAGAPAAAPAPAAAAVVPAPTPPAPMMAIAPPPADAPPAGAMLTASPAPPGAAADDASPIYSRWWFWTAIGVAVAGGVVAAVALSSSGGSTPTADTTFGTMPAKRP